MCFRVSKRFTETQLTLNRALTLADKNDENVFSPLCFNRREPVSELEIEISYILILLERTKTLRAIYRVIEFY